MSVDWSLPTRGFSLFPLLPETKVPALAWDSFKTGARRAVPDDLNAWATGGYNSGVATGLPSGCFVLDCDDMVAWAEAITRGIPDTFTVKTPRGWHFYFRRPADGCGNRAKLAGIQGWDIRGDGGYVVGPGSHYVPSPDELTKGKVEGTYQIEADLPLAPAPQWLLDLLAKPEHVAPVAEYAEAETTSPYGRAALNGALEDLADAGSGNLSDRIYTTSARVGELVAGGEIRHDEGWESILEGLYAKGVGHEDKALGTMRRGWEKGWSNPKTGTARPAMTADQAFGQRDSVQAPPAPADGEQPIDVPAAPTPFGPSFYPAIVTGGLFAEYFAGCTYVAHDNAMWTPGGVMLKRESFNVIYGGPGFALSQEGNKSVKSAWDGFSNNEHVRLPRVARTVFRPECNPGAIMWDEGLPVLNAYTPVPTPCTPGDVTPFLRHVHKLLPKGDDAEILLNWMASCVQNPGSKFQWWPVIQGGQGNGKTLILSVMIAAVGARYSHLVNPEAMQKTGNQFNAWIERKLFLGFEEIRTGDGQHQFAEMMKDTVTNMMIASEGKGRDQGTVDNRANGIMLTNHDDAMPVEDGDRRYGIFYTAQQSVADLERDGMTGRYFPDLYEWLRGGGYAHVTHYLRTYPLRVDMDPAQGWRAPTTSSTDSAKANSLGNIELEVLERVEQGQVGFKGGWVSAVALGAVMERLKVGRKRWPIVLKRLGYRPHPALPKGRCTSPLTDQSRPILYIRAGHADEQLAAGAVGAAYEAAQGGETGSNVVPFARP